LHFAALLTMEKAKVSGTPEINSGVHVTQASARRAAGDRGDPVVARLSQDQQAEQPFGALAVDVLAGAIGR